MVQQKESAKPRKGGAKEEVPIHSEQDDVGDPDKNNSESQELEPGMDPQGFLGPSEKIVKPLTPEALTAFKAAQDRAGIIYISRIPPGMQPTKVRHLMSQHGDVGRIYLQQEGAFCSWDLNNGD